VTTTTLVVGRYGGCTARGVVLRNQAILLVVILRVTYSAVRSNGPIRGLDSSDLSITLSQPEEEEATH